MEDDLCVAMTSHRFTVPPSVSTASFRCSNKRRRAATPAILPTISDRSARTPPLRGLGCHLPHVLCCVDGRGNPGFFFFPVRGAKLLWRDADKNNAPSRRNTPAQKYHRSHFQAQPGTQSIKILRAPPPLPAV